MEKAVMGYTRRAGSDTMAYIVRPKVMEWAMVNVLTCSRIDRHWALSRKIPTTKRMWSNPFGRMWVNPRPKYCRAICAEVAEGGGAMSEIAGLACEPSSQNVCTGL